MKGDASNGCRTAPAIRRVAERLRADLRYRVEWAISPILRCLTVDSRWRCRIWRPLAADQGDGLGGASRPGIPVPG